MENNLGSLHHMSKYLLQMFNQVDNDLKFTIELMSDYIDAKIPTLDFTHSLVCRGVEEGNTWELQHEFYSKPMKRKYCKLEISARAWSSKTASLLQEVVRRSLHYSERLPVDGRLAELKSFIKTMRISGCSKKMFIVLFLDQLPMKGRY